VGDPCPRGRPGVPPTSHAAGRRSHSLAYPSASNVVLPPMGFGATCGPAGGSPWSFGRQLGVTYHVSHVGRLCKAIRWSPQNLLRRVRQRDEAAIARWRDETWPAINRGPKPSTKRSSSETSPAFIPCPVSCVPMRPWGRRPCCESGGHATICRRSRPFPLRARCIFTAKRVPSMLPTSWPFWNTCCGKGPTAW
jgi:winged helix-turn-helix protein